MEFMVALSFVSEIVRAEFRRRVERAWSTLNDLLKSTNSDIADIDTAARRSLTGLGLTGKIQDLIIDTFIDEKLLAMTCLLGRHNVRKLSTPPNVENAIAENMTRALHTLRDVRYPF